MEALSPIITPLNLATVLAVSYKYLFYHPSREEGPPI
jgi:hypothetical protein